MVASIPVYTGLLSSISYSLVSISLTSSLVIPWPPMKNNCPASYTKFSQTGCYILYCPLQSTFSFLDGSEFTMFSKSLIFCRFPLDSNSFVHPELGLPTYTLLWCISLTGSEQSGISFFFNFTYVSVNFFAILSWFTCFAIHYYPHTWFCSTYT